MGKRAGREAPEYNQGRENHPDRHAKGFALPLGIPATLTSNTLVPVYEEINGIVHLAGPTRGAESPRLTWPVRQTNLLGLFAIGR